MENANKQALEYIQNHLTQDVKDYLTKNGEDLSAWITDQIEIALDKKKSS